MSHSDAFIDLMDSAIRLAETAVESPISDEGWTPVTIIGHVSDVDEQVLSHDEEHFEALA